jgi:glycosyltransferase involved in cell wall biosynthesis
LSEKSTNISANKSPDLRIVAVIPAFNESENIANILTDTIINVNYAIVVDDGSSDDTALRAQTFSNTKVLRNKRNIGKGSSLRRGFIEALKFYPDIVVTLDADGQHNPKDIPRLVNAVKEQDADIVIGSRFTKGSIIDAPRSRQFGLSLINSVNRRLVRSLVNDTSSGFRAYTRHAISSVLDLDAKGYALEFEQIAKAESYGLNIIEVPVSVKYKGLTRTSKKSSVVLGANILSTLLKIAVERRPLLYFGTSGLILVAIAAIVAVEALILFNETRYFSIPLALVTLGVGLIGLLLLLISFVLQVMKRIRHILYSNLQAARK